jgi:flagellar protein FlaF
MGYAQAAHAYATLDPTLISAKRAEARVFSDATRRLKAAYDEDGATMARRAAALTDNLRLWRTIALCAADEGNAMSDDLRAGLFSLAAFVERQTSLLLRDEGSAETLIDINARMITGLSTERA